MSTIILYPPELLSEICRAVFLAACPSHPSSLDPLYCVQTLSSPTGVPSAYPSGTWLEAHARYTLLALCLVNKAFYGAAKPWLWSRIHVRLPQHWLAFVDAVSGDPSDEQAVEGAIVQAIEQVAVTTVSGSTARNHEALDPERRKAAEELRESVIARLSDEHTLPDGSIPPGLLSPPASREPSPRRFQARAQSPGRWRLMRAISSAVQQAVAGSSLAVYVPTPEDPRPGRHIQHLDFNHFRTIGMRRSVEEGVLNRFVTANRVYRVLQEMPNLLAFGATEYMDGALNKEVLTELLFRGRHSQPPALQHSTCLDAEAEEWLRRRECLALQAIDFCGCVSAVFVGALKDVVEAYLGGDIDEQETRRGRHSTNTVDCVVFPDMRRLGLRGAKSIEASVLESFVLACPFLTHLDLSGTRCTPDLLHNIGASNTVHLKALSLGRCPALTGSSLVWLLTRGRATFTLTQLSLYGDVTFPSPLTEEELRDIITQAPCIQNGRLEYLDLSSSPMTSAILQVFPRQPALRSLGLSYIPHLPLKCIAEFIARSCCNLEIISTINTSPELIGPSRYVSLALHQCIVAPLTKPPFTFSLSTNTSTQSPATRLRVIELSNQSLNGLGAGSDGWQIVRSKGGRGWYVDSAAGWCATDGDRSILRRDLAKDHPIRKEIDKLADACGNVSSGIGWHARKMEILHGEGLLGREDGLYGAVSFAYGS